jgi:hypothetical protein
MLLETKAPRNKKRRVSRRGATRFPGLLDAAKALGVHRNHLYLVLSGRRVSRSLTQRYADLKGGLSS